MTAHLLIMYPHPKDVKEFDRAYREEHLPYPNNRDAKGNCCLKRHGSVGPRGVDQFRRLADNCGCH